MPHVECCNSAAAVLHNQLYVVGGCWEEGQQDNIHGFGAFALMAGCVAPTFPNVWHSTHGNTNMMVPWKAIGEQYSQDLQDGTMN